MKNIKYETNLNELYLVNAFKASDKDYRKLHKGLLRKKGNYELISKMRYYSIRLLFDNIDSFIYNYRVELANENLISSDKDYGMGLDSFLAIAIINLCFEQFKKHNTYGDISLKTEMVIISNFLNTMDSNPKISKLLDKYRERIIKFSNEKYIYSWRKEYKNKHLQKREIYSEKVIAFSEEKTYEELAKSILEHYRCYYSIRNYNDNCDNFNDNSDYVSKFVEILQNKNIDFKEKVKDFESTPALIKLFARRLFSFCLDEDYLEVMDMEKPVLNTNSDAFKYILHILNNNLGVVKMVKYLECISNNYINMEDFTLYL